MREHKTAPVNPIDEIGDIACSNERTMAGIDTVIEMMHDVLEESHGGFHHHDRLYQAWLLLLLTRDHFHHTDRRLAEAETALLKLNSGHSVS